MYNESPNQEPIDVEMTSTPDSNTDMTNDSGITDVAVNGALEPETPTNPASTRRVFPGAFPGQGDSMIEAAASTSALSAATVPVRKKRVDISKIRREDANSTRPALTARTSSHLSGVRGVTTSGHSRTRIDSNNSSAQELHGSSRRRIDWNRTAGTSGTGASLSTDAPTDNQSSSRCAKSLAPAPPARPTTAVSAKRPLPQEDASKPTTGSERKRLMVEHPNMRTLRKDFETATKKRDELEADLVIARQTVNTFDARMTEVQREHQDTLTKLQSEHQVVLDKNNVLFMESEKARHTLQQVQEDLGKAIEARDAALKECNAMIAQRGEDADKATTSQLLLNEAASQTEHVDAFADLWAKYDALVATSTADRDVFAEEARRLRIELTEKTYAMEALQRLSDEAGDRYADRVGDLTGTFQRQRSVICRADRAIRALSVTLQVTQAAHDQQTALATLTNANLTTSLDEIQTRLDTALVEGSKVQGQRDELLQHIQTLRTQLLTAETKAIGLVEERNQALQTVAQLEGDIALAHARSTEFESQATAMEKQRDDALNSTKELELHLQTEMNGAEDELAKLWGDLVKARAVITEMTGRQNEATASLENLKSQLQAKNDELKGVAQERDQAGLFITQLRSDFTQASAESASLKTAIAQIEKQRDEAMESATKLQAEIATEVHGVNDEREKIWRDLVESRAACASLASTVAEMTGRQNENTTSIEELEVQLQTRTDELAETAQQRNDAFQTITELQGDLTQATAESASLKSEVSAMEKRRDDALNTVEALNAEIATKIPAAEEEKNNVRMELNQARAASALLQNKHDQAIEFIQTFRTQLQEAKIASQNEKKALETNLQHVRAQLAEALETEKGSQEKLNQAEQVAKDATQAHEEVLKREQHKVEVFEAQVADLSEDLDKLRTRIAELEAGTPPGDEGDDEMDVDHNGPSSRSRGKQPEGREHSVSPPQAQDKQPASRAVQRRSYLLRHSAELATPLKDRIIRPNTRRSVTPGPSSSSQLNRGHSPLTHPPSSSRQPTRPDSGLSTIPETIEQVLSNRPATPSPLASRSSHSTRNPGSTAHASSRPPPPPTPNPAPSGSRLPREDDFIPAPSTHAPQHRRPPSPRQNSPMIDDANSSNGEDAELPSLGADFAQLFREFRQFRQEFNNAQGGARGMGDAPLTGTTYPWKKRQKARLRAPARNHMMGIVLAAVRDILKISTDNHIIDVIDDVLADPDDVEAYMEGRADAPTLDPPRLYFEIPEHPWNGELSRLFADAVLAKHPELEHEAVCRQFIARIKAIRRVLYKYIAKPGEDEDQAMERFKQNHIATLQSARRRGRQSELYDSRIHICQDGERKDDPAWVNLRNMVYRLGYDGQSSDESDGPVVCHVKVQFWRNPQVTRLLRWIDSKRSMTNALGNRRPGAPPRVRRMLQNRSTREEGDIVAHLPGNLYDETWYNSLERNLQARLQTEDDIELPVLQATQEQLHNATL